MPIIAGFAFSTIFLSKMPIYAYKCESCGHSKDALQKLSDAPLVTCPACGADTFKKQLTAAGFQLKGTGWYATDFKGGSTSAPAVSSTGGDAAPAAAAASTPAPSTDTGGGACGTSCACH